MPYEIGIPCVLIALYILFHLRCVGKYERFAVFIVGQFTGLKGPGLLFKTPFTHCDWYRIAVGDRGELSAPGVGKFKKIQIPVEMEGKANAGSLIRITDFSEKIPIVAVDADQRKTVKCEKCGHEMQLV